MSLKDDLKLNTPRRTPGHATKSHVVKTNVDGKPKMIRFGEQGANTAGKPSSSDSAADKAKRKSFKARHASNIAKGPASAAYWANRVKWAEGGPVKDQRPANLRQIMTDVGADTLSGMFGPIAASAYSLGNQYFTDKSIEELEADKAAVDKALNYNPRTSEAQAVNEYTMGKLGEGVAALAEKYNENKDSLGYIPDMVDYGMEQYNELDPETQFATGNVLTVGEVVPIGKLAGMAKGAVRNAGDRRMISNAADDIPDESSYLPLQDRLEEMGARQTMVGYHGSPHSLNEFDRSRRGTGEGAQAFGAGVYIAESEGVATSYKNALSDGLLDADGSEFFAKGTDSSEVMAKDILINANGDYKKAEKYLEDARSAGLGNLFGDETKAVLKRWEDSGVKPQGYLYEVDLPDEKIAKMMDWDKPLSDQPEIAKLLGMSIEEVPSIEDYLKLVKKGDSDNPNYAYQVEGMHAPTPEAAAKFARDNAINGMQQRTGMNQTGKQYYEELARGFHSSPNMNIMDAQSEASKVLSEAGVPGIKYLDGTSRKAGEGTRNFVVFDENNLTVLTRNGEKVNAPPKPIMFKDVEQPELTPEQLSRSFKDGEITDYGRKIARKRAATDMAGQTAEVKKLSEVLGDMNIEGKVSMVATQSDRTGIKDGAGPGYALIGRQYSEMAKLYQDQFGEAPVPRMLDKNGEITDYPVWAVDAKSTIATLRNNLKEEGTILVPMIGAPNQLRTNKEIFKKLKKEFMAGIKANKLDADQADKINLNLEALTGNKMDIRDPSSWIELEKTFDGRAALADIMSGKTPQAIAAVGARSKWRTKLNKKRAADGLEPLDLNPKTAPLGARKGQIFDYDKILEDSTESVLLGAGTYDIGPSLILPSRYRQSETMRDAHPGFKEQLMGKLATDDIFTPAPLEIAMPDFINHGRGLHMKSGPNKRPFNSGAWGMNARMGYPNQGLPSQKIDEDYLKYLQDMGYAEGGEVEVAEEVGVEYNAERISAMADALMNGDSYAEGGEVKKQATRDDTIGYNAPNLRRVVGDVITDFASGIFGPIASSAISLGEQAFTDNTIEEMVANNEAYNDALNFNPRTKEAQAVNKVAMQGLGAVVNEGIEYYDRNKKHLSPEVQQSIAATGQAWEDLDPRTKFLIGNAATVGEVLPIGGAVRAGLRVGRNAVDQRNLNAAAEQVPSEASYRPLQDRLEEMGARQLQVREPGDNNFLNEFDSNVLSRPDSAIFTTEDGYTFYQNSLGEIVDHLDPNFRDETYPNLTEFMEANPNVQRSNSGPSNSPITSPKTVAESLTIKSTPLALMNIDELSADEILIRKDKIDDDISIDDIENEFKKQIENGTADLPPEMLDATTSAKFDFLTSKMFQSITNDEISRTPKLDYFNKTFPEAAAARTEKQYPGATMTNRWLNTKLKKYLQNELGTGQNDSIVRVAGDADNMHYEVTSLDDNNIGIDEFEEQLNLGEYDVNFYGMENNPNQYNLDSASDLAMSFEGASDRLLEQQQAGTLRDEGRFRNRLLSNIRNDQRNQTRGIARGQGGPEDLMDEMYEANPFLDKVPDDTNMFTLDAFTADELQLEVLTQGVRQLVDPTNALGLPPELYLPGDKILRMSVGDVSARVGDLRIWKEAEVTKGFVKLAQESPRMRKDVFNLAFAKEQGATWVDIPDTSNPANRKICQLLGKGGKWCTSKNEEALNYGSGEERLTVMLDGDGKPHLQIQFNTYEDPQGNVTVSIGEIKPPGNAFNSPKSESYIKQEPNYEAKLADSVMHFLNKTDNEMIVRDINADELELFGLVDIDDEINMNEILDEKYGARDGLDMDEVRNIYDVYMSRRRFSPEQTPRIVREEEIMDYMDQGVSDLDRSDFARGGAVIAKYDADKINKLAQGIMPENFAEGGPVIYNASRINEIANQLLQEA